MIYTISTKSIDYFRERSKIEFKIQKENIQKWICREKKAFASYLVGNWLFQSMKKNGLQDVT